LGGRAEPQAQLDAAGVVEAAGDGCASVFWTGLALGPQQEAILGVWLIGSQPQLCVSMVSSVWMPAIFLMKLNMIRSSVIVFWLFKMTYI